MRFRIKDAPATFTLLALIAAVFVLEEASGGATSPRVLVQFGALYPPLVWAGQWWRLIAVLFVHVGLAHVALNGWALYQLGMLFEISFGSARMLAVYFACGLGSSLASLFWTRGLSAGASGAIFGLLGALLVFLLRHRQRLRPEAKTLMIELAFWAVINIAYGFSNPAIDNAAHLGGCAVGALIGLTLVQHQRSAV
ncbi:MAG TPA: rhomboid family intramembrane serine protease [Thermoanaerobaculia bacterium]|nr:rhomboid family intramembrane serine protease [Thermoanaerobaculia bacterium]